MFEGRVVVVGDPQTTFSQFLAVLRARGLLTDGDRIRDNVRLITIGDYFDFARPGIELLEIRRSGVDILKWLVDHPPEQVRILAGNHDLCRVMEFAGVSDADFADARALAESGQAELLHQRYPTIPSPGVVTRDFSAYCEAQREWVQRTLLSGRMSLGAVGSIADGREVLVTHAGVTTRELAILDLPYLSPRDIASGLNEYLAGAVEQVASAWRAGDTAPLDLAPLHIAGFAGSEGGGLLYHRPSTEREPWGFDSAVPRRFDPRTLPRGLLQACGHTQHRKCAQLMPDSAGLATVANGALRTLSVNDDGVVYSEGMRNPESGEACLWMVDSGLNRWPAHEVQILELAGLLRT